MAYSQSACIVRQTVQAKLKQEVFSPSLEPVSLLVFAHCSTYSCTAEAKKHHASLLLAERLVTTVFK